jgi:hypothetical protein
LTDGSRRVPSEVRKDLSKPASVPRRRIERVVIAGGAKVFTGICPNYEVCEKEAPKLGKEWNPNRSALLERCGAKLYTEANHADTVKASRRSTRAGPPTGALIP